MTAAYDAIVVGAGPAGALASWEMARAGWRVLLLDRYPFPRDKACGGALTNRAIAALPFNVVPVIERRVPWYQSNHSTRSPVFSAYRNSPIFITCRAVLDDFLVRQFISIGGIFRPREPVRSVLEVDDVIQVTTALSVYRTRRVVLACGGGLGIDASGRLRALGAPSAFALEGVVRPATTILARRISPVAEFDYRFPDAGYSWIFPRRDSLNVGIGTIRSFDNTLTREMLLKRFEGVASALGASITDVRGAPLAVGGIAYQPMGNILNVGDAAGFTSDASGEGISSAIISGRLAGRAFVEGARTGLPPATIYSTALSPLRLWLKAQAELSGHDRMYGG